MSEPNPNRRLFTGVFSPDRSDLYSFNPDAPQLIVFTYQDHVAERQSAEMRGRRSLGSLGVRVSSERILHAPQPSGDQGYLYRLVAMGKAATPLTPHPRKAVDAYIKSLPEDDPERYFLSQTLSRMRVITDGQTSENLL